MTPTSRLGLIVNFTRAHAHESFDVLVRAATEAGITLYTPPSPETGAALPGTVCCAVEDFITAGVQGIISLGGDGSLLAAAHALAGAPLPIIGFNIGHLGYLTAVNEEGFSTALHALAAGRYSLEERTTLTAHATHDGLALTSFPDALNDIVIARPESGHAFGLQLELDDFPVAHYLCDGLILSTPTGSTAYSLSVGGPVVAPTAKALVVSVIAPHTLSARPLVISDATRITVRIDAAEGAIAYADGQRAALLCSGDAVHIATAPKPLRLMVLEGHNPYEAFSRKLGWSAGFQR